MMVWNFLSSVNGNDIRLMQPQRDALKTVVFNYTQIASGDVNTQDVLKDGKYTHSRMYT